MWNKFGAKKTEYNGKLYDSKLEAKYALELDLRLRAKDIRSWEGQIPFQFVVNGEKICKHIVDFKITHNDGSIEYVETKGRKTRDWVIKRKLLNALFLKGTPGVRYTVVT